MNYKKINPKTIIFGLWLVIIMQTDLMAFNVEITTSDLDQNNTVIAGKIVKLTANPTNGTPEYEYVWTNSSDKEEIITLNNSIDVSPNKRTTYKVQVTDVNGFKCNAEITIYVQTYLIEVEFVNNPIPLIGQEGTIDGSESGDYTDFTYLTPHWQVNDVLEADGITLKENAEDILNNITDNDLRQNPVCYVSGNYIAYTAKIVNPFENYDGDINIRLTLPNENKSFYETELNSEEVIFVGSYNLFELSTSQIQMYDPLIINWEVKKIDSEEWHFVGQSRNQLYATLLAPLVNVTGKGVKKSNPHISYFSRYWL